MLSIKVDYGIGDTPAAVSREDSTIYINPPLYNKLTPFQRKFVLFHELGHYTLNSKNEIDADTFAFKRLAGTQYRSLKQCIAAIADTLEDGNQTKEERYNNIVYQALLWDYQHGNKAVKEDLKTAEKLCAQKNEKIMRNNTTYDRYAETRRFMERYNGTTSSAAQQMMKVVGCTGVAFNNPDILKALEDSANAREQLEAQAQSQRDSEKQRELQRKKEMMVEAALSLIILLQIVTLIVLIKKMN